MRLANPVLVEVTRGDYVESRHRGAACVAAAEGTVCASWGNVEALVLPRSAVKPLQALPLVESGGAARFGVSDAELALACASHSGGPEHVVRIERWLDRLGVSVDALVCGPHPPLSIRAAEAMLREGRAPSRLHNNCSGKHAGMLTLALDRDRASAGRYAAPDHPIQRAVLAVLSEMGDADLSAAPVAVDGCGVPTFALPLVALARAFARLADPSRLHPSRAAACRRVVVAMASHPELVAGAGRFDTVAIAATRGKAIVKSGAEGVVACALPGRGLGLAVKIDDGAKRAAEAAMAGLLLAFGPKDDAAATQLKHFCRAPVYNTQGAVVGRLTIAEDWPRRSSGG